MISSVSAHGLKPHLVNGTNAATNAAAARYLASLQLNGANEFASRAPGYFVHQQQQHGLQQQGNQPQQLSGQQNTHNKVPAQHFANAPNESRALGERHDGSVSYMAPSSYQAPQPAYQRQSAPFAHLRPAPADSRAHMHLQFGNHMISPVKEAPADTRRFSTGAQWEDADPSLVAAMYCKFFEGAVAQPDRRMSTGRVMHHGGHTVHHSYQKESGTRAGVHQQQKRRPYLPCAEELGPGWF